MRRDNSIKDSDIKQSKKEGIKGLRKAGAWSILFLEDKREGDLTAAHGGGASAKDNLRFVVAHRAIADQLESVIVENLGWSKAKLKEVYKEIQEHDVHEEIHNEYRIGSRKE